MIVIFLAPGTIGAIGRAAGAAAAAATAPPRKFIKKYLLLLGSVKYNDNLSEFLYVFISYLLSNSIVLSS